MVVNASGYRADELDCFLDADILTFFGETATEEQYATGRLLGLTPPTEVSAVTGAEAAIDSGQISEGDKVGILVGNGAAVTTAGDRVDDTLKDAGFETVKVEVNTVGGDSGSMNQESAVAVGTFDAEGVDHVMVLMPFTQVEGFWSELEASGSEVGVTVIDVVASACTPFGASRTPPFAEGSPCVTSFDSWVAGGGGLREPNEFEEACISHWNETLAVDIGGPHTAGVPSGDVIETLDGEMLYSQIAPNECTQVALIESALTDAGTDLTRDSAYDAFLALGEGDAAMLSNGRGSFGPDKPYYADTMWNVRLVLASADETPRGEDGMFNGCAAPSNCWISEDGSWFEISG